MSQELKIPRAQRNQSPGHEVIMAKRRHEVIRLRKRGYSMQRIGETLGCSTQTVSNDLKFLLQELVQLTAAETDEYRQLELERLDKMLEICMNQIEEGGNGALWAIDRALQISERRAKLLGLDKPLQHILQGDKEAKIQVQHSYGLDEKLLAHMKRLAELEAPPVETEENETIDITPPEALGGKY